MVRRATLWLLLVLAGRAPALAQPALDATARAEALNDEGKTRIKVVDLEGAAGKFREALAILPDPRYYYNLCYTLDKLGQLREARAACEVVERGGADDRLADKARTLGTAIDAKLDRGGGKRPGGDSLTVLDPGDTLADGESVAATPALGSSAGHPVASGQAEAAPRPTTQDPVALVGVEAATAGRPSRTFAVRLGLGNAQIKLDPAPSDGLEGRVALAIGGGVIAWLGDRVGLQLDGFLARRGAGIDLVDGGLRLRGNFDFTYFDVVGAARFEPGRSPSLRAYGLLGGYLGLKLAAELTTDDAGSGELADTAPVDAGLLVGGGLALGDYRRAFTIDVRYQLGLKDVAAGDGTSDLPAQGGSARHRVVMLMAGYEL